jgi:lipoprotein-releasing system ATP-binding protein
MNSRRPILSVRNLHRTYKSGDGILTVMAGADIDIYPGEMIGLIGPSGSGSLYRWTRMSEAF